MSERLQWLRRLVQGPEPAAPTHPGKAATLRAADAVAVVERRAGATLFEDAAAAAGAARGGLRAGAIVDLSTVGHLPRVMADAVRGLVPLVVHAVGDPDDVRPAGTGAFVLAPTTPAEAVDLTVAARWLTERALVPGVVLHRNRENEQGEVHLPSGKDLAGLLGASGDPLDCPTDGQRMLFGASRCGAS